MRRLLGAWGRVLPRQILSIVAGLLVYVSFPPRPLWFLAPVGIALLVLVLVGRGLIEQGVVHSKSVSSKSPGRRWRGAFGYAYLAGLGFLVPLLPWVGVYVGAVPWLALAGVESLFIGLFGVVAVTIARAPVPRWLLPVLLAAGWSLTEWLRSSVPFGGFPWGRLAFGQSEGWLVSLASIGGAPLLSFGVALTGAGLAALVVGLASRSRRQLIVGAVISTVLAPIVAAAIFPTLPTMADADTGRTITVAAIQGSVPRLGLDFNSQRRAVLDLHVKRTLQLAADVRAGRSPQPDVVVWPENSSDIDPLRNVDAYQEISATASAIGAPILVGAVLANDDGTTTNSVIVWDPITGPGSRHDKSIIQPFGEYIPYRSFFEHFSSYAAKAGNFVPGHDDGVVHASGIPIGVATCYEVAFDRALTRAVRDGAQFIAVPTNNATFGRTEMTYQQLAMSRVRAVEHGRAVVVAATTGVSAIIAPNGAVQQESPLFVPDALVARIPLRTGITISTRLGAWPEIVLCLVAGAAFVAGLPFVARRLEARVGAGHPADGSPADEAQTDTSTDTQHDHTVRTVRDVQTVPAPAGEEEPDGNGDAERSREL
ncbi:apolipoprotein N-acyltransferase [Speluncibacter jeojiensis]|uniref:apolipoprotein N-acyltransferase n=1 Tax=Speluncibacter jeojiensis TaxID=2710754 RepID=UPI0038CDC112